MNDNNEEEEYDDALGQLFWDYFNHKNRFGITERNDGFIAVKILEFGSLDTRIGLR